MSNAHRCILIANLFVKKLGLILVTKISAEERETCRSYFGLLNYIGT